MQAQGHFQLVCRMEDGGQNPQAAANAPRWRVTKGLEVLVEEGFSVSLAEALAAKGHNIVWKKKHEFGGAQIVCATDGGYVGASDHSKDGHSAAF